MSKVKQFFLGGLGATTGFVLFTVPADERWLLRTTALYPTGLLSNNLVTGIGADLASATALRSYTANAGVPVDDLLPLVIDPGQVLVVVIPAGDSWNAYFGGTVYPA